jgi:hypothetical protein
MKLVINPIWGPNFEFEEDSTKINLTMFPFGTTDDGAIILGNLNRYDRIVLMPVSGEQWIKIYFSNDPAYASYFIDTMENILNGTDVIEGWVILDGKDIIEGHGLTEKFNSLIKGE